MFESINYLQHLSYLGIFLLIILGGIGLPFPEDVIIILCGFLVAHKILIFFPAVITLYLSILLVDYFIYLAGRKYGRKIIEQEKIKRILPEKLFSILETKFNKYGLLVVFFGRHIIGLRAQILIAAGIMRISRIKMLSADAMSIPITIAIMMAIGYLGGNSIKIWIKDMQRIEHLAIVIGMILVAVVCIAWYYRARVVKHSR